MSSHDATSPQATPTEASERLGVVLVAAAAIAWSLGGAIGRYLDATDPWTTVFWRSTWASVFLIGFMLWRDGARGMLRLFAGMGLPGLAVGCCFAIASSVFVIALQYTTVANIVLMLAGVPLIAALISRIFLGETIARSTWLAIGAVIAGVAIMVSDSLTGNMSPIGDGLALTIAFAFAIATVVTRRFAHVRMTPATCLGTLMAGSLAALLAPRLAVTGTEMGLLFAFGALNLGLGLALFATGARLIPAALAALLGMLETVLSPVWVWAIHAEVPSARTMIGGAVIFAALLTHLTLGWHRSRPRRPGATGVAQPR
ncbi:MAG: DMT family transporter [Rhizobiaceae bacterium]|nr:DMT family transporter [Rhizobiaceae bacterium]MCV0406098.1 DMT family transporter [Rhizobiaceae bacterium]